LLVTSLLLHMGLARLTPLPALWLLGAGAFFAKAGGAALSIKIFDKKAARYEAKDFGDVDATN